MERERKASAQRRDILVAATDRAQEAGFHSATMDQIARGAGLSVGQVYRHFDNKDAIIGAVAQARARKVLDPFEKHVQGQPVLETLLRDAPSALRQARDTKVAALDLEILAEAERNAVVAEVVHRVEAAQLARGVEALTPFRKPDWTEDDMVARIAFLGLILDGLQLRGARGSTAAPAAMERAYRDILTALFG
ncbi:MAG: helix-turn-helix domain-containing protein [Caulobacter sp.]